MGTAEPNNVNSSFECIRTSISDSSSIFTSTIIPNVDLDEDESICFYYQNIRGLRTKTSRFYVATTECYYDVIALTETGLIPSIHDSELFNPGDFMVYRSDRNHLNSDCSIGGGVLIAVRSNIGSEYVAVPGTDNVEMIVVKCNFIGRIAFICCLYIPSGSSAETYMNCSVAIERMFDCIGSDPSHDIFILGDFNIPSFEWSTDPENINVLLPTNIGSGSRAEVVLAAMSGGLSQINHVLNYRNTLLDLVFCNCTDDVEVLKCENPLSTIDVHHEPIEIYFDAATSPIMQSPTTSVYNFKKANFEGLNSHLAIFEWKFIFNKCSCIESAVDKFYEILMRSFKSFVPIKNSNGSRHPPWYNRQIKNLKNVKRKRHRNYKITRSDADYQLFSIARKNLLNCQNTAYKKYISETESRLCSDPSKFWSYVQLKRNTSGFPNIMYRGLVKSSNSSEICELFADFFNQNYVNTAPTIDPLITVNVDELIGIGSISVTTDEVYKHLINIDTNKGDGPDHIAPIFLRNCASALSIPLTILFNWSLNSGVFPIRWKISSITPIFKSGSRANVEQYRGIAILPTFGKFFESIVYGLLSGHFKHVITDAQHGFFEKRTTSTNLVQFTNYVVDIIEAHGQVDVIYTDFSKAFDRVCHKYLIAKLEQIGVHSSLLNWITSYLIGRKQFVQLSGWKSRQFDVTSGVPQGSHLGPLLFILYINDVIKQFKHSQCLMYADDLKIYSEIRSMSDALKLQKDLDSLTAWSVRNGLDLNLSKCCSMTFTRSQNPINFNYTIGTVALKRVKVMRDLGVLFDEKVSFVQHVDAVVTKAYSMLGFMKRICSDFVNPYALKSIYCAHVRSHLEYAAVVWRPNYLVHIAKLESIQKKFILYALRRLGWSNGYELPSYEDRCRLINLETLSRRRENMGAFFIFDLLTDQINAPVLLEKIHLNVPARSLRSHTFLNTVFHRTNYGDTEPITNMARTFNRFADLYESDLSRVNFRSKVKSS